MAHSKASSFQGVLEEERISLDSNLLYFGASKIGLQSLAMEIMRGNLLGTVFSVVYGVHGLTTVMDVRCCQRSLQLLSEVYICLRSIFTSQFQHLK